MKTNYEIRYAAHPRMRKSYDTARLRRDFLIEKVFSADEVNMVYLMYDRMIVGGAMPVAETLRLEAIDPLKASFFLTRREMGIFNVGGPGVVKAGDSVFELGQRRPPLPRFGRPRGDLPRASATPRIPRNSISTPRRPTATTPDKKVHESRRRGGSHGLARRIERPEYQQDDRQPGAADLPVADGHDRVAARQRVEHDARARALAPHGSLFLFRGPRGACRVPPDGRGRGDAPHLDEGRPGRAVARMVDPQRRSDPQLHLHLGHGRREPRLRRSGLFENNRPEIIHPGIFSKTGPSTGQRPASPVCYFRKSQYRQSP